MAGTATFIVDIFDQHLDELGFLWGQWRGALQDPDYTLKSVRDLEERIRAHLQGVQVPGEKAWPRLVETLEGDDPGLAFAAAYALLHTGVPEHTERVLGAFAIVEDEFFAAVTQALMYGPLTPAALDQVRAALSAQPPLRAAAAAEVLAFHDALQLTPEQLRWFLEDEAPATRHAGWRLAALLGSALQPQTYAAALRDDDPAVPSLALHAGAWAAVPGVLPALRHLLTRTDGPARLGPLRLLAVIGTAEDVAMVRAALDDPALGPARYDLAASAAAPSLVPVLIAAMHDPDPAAAAAAGAAFARLTGVDVESNRRAQVPPPDGKPADEFEQEFAEEVMLPDAALAEREWNWLRPRLEPMPRICRGLDASRALDPLHATVVDMLSRHEASLRARFTGAWQGTLLSLERFPQGTGATGMLTAPPQEPRAASPAPALQPPYMGR